MKAALHAKQTASAPASRGVQDDVQRGDEGKRCVAAGVSARGVLLLLAAPSPESMLDCATSGLRLGIRSRNSLPSSPPPLTLLLLPATATAPRRLGVLVWLAARDSICRRRCKMPASIASPSSPRVLRSPLPSRARVPAVRACTGDEATTGGLRRRESGLDRDDACVSAGRNAVPPAFAVAAVAACWRDIVAAPATAEGAEGAVAPALLLPPLCGAWCSLLFVPPNNENILRRGGCADSP